MDIPLFNEVAAIYIGHGLTNPNADPKFKAALEEYLPRLENVDVVYKQNTADELNVVVPSFPQYDSELQRLTEDQIEKITGGAFEIVGIVGIVGGLGVIGLMRDIHSGNTKVITGMENPAINTAGVVNFPAVCASSRRGRCRRHTSTAGRVEGIRLSAPAPDSGTYGRRVGSIHIVIRYTDILR